MTLRWRVFEKSARRGIRAEVRQSESLRHEYKLARKAARGRSTIRFWLLRIICAFLPAMLLFFRVVPENYISAIIFLWTLTLAFHRAAQFHALLHYAPNLAVFDFVPISDRDIFRVQWRQLLLLSCWAMLEFTVAFAALFSRLHGSVMLAIGLSITAALVQCLFILAMAVCLAAFAPKKHLVVVSWILGASTFAILLVGANSPMLCQWLASLGWWLPPFATISQMAGLVEIRSPLHFLFPAARAVAVLAIAAIGFRCIRREFPFDERILEPREALQATAEQFTLTVEDAQSVIQKRHFLTNFGWKKAGLVEALVSRLLTPRERLVAEFMVAAKPRWTGHLRSFATLFLLVVILGWPYAGKLITVAPQLLFFMIFFFWVTFTATWRCFAVPAAGGLQSPIYAVYPVSYWELMGVALKANVVRYSLDAAVLLMAAAVLTHDPVFLHSTSVGFVIKALAFGYMIQPLLAIAPISPATNDTSKAKRWIPIILIGLVLLGSAITFFLVWNYLAVIVAGFIFTALAVLVLAVYGRWFNGSRFDLVPSTRQGVTVENPSE